MGHPSYCLHYRGRELETRALKERTLVLVHTSCKITALLTPGSCINQFPDPQGHWSLKETGRSHQEGSRSREPWEIRPTGAPSQFCLESALFEIEPCSHYVAIDYLPFCIVEMYPPLSRLISLTVECCTQTLQ